MDELDLIRSRSEFHAAVRGTLAEVATQGCREMLWSDVDFSDWPLSDPALIDTLTRWAASHRRLIVLATQFDDIVRRHARWVEWRRTWSHVVSCHANDELEPGQMPTLLLAPGVVCLRLVDAQRYRGSVSRDVADALRWRESFDAVLQRSAPALPATTLGL
jgi:hypothetical protein